MKARRFDLLPFPSAGVRSEMKIEGSVTRCSNTLSIRYGVFGPMADIIISEPVALPDRKHGLWEETCFEFFVALRNTPRYWEFNLSPTGHWNVYRFADYRQGMQEEAALTTLPFKLRCQPETMTLAVDCCLDAIIPAKGPLEVAVSAVLMHHDSDRSYWALVHPGPQPDFHRRDSFVIQWEGEKST